MKRTAILLLHLLLVVSAAYGDVASNLSDYMSRMEAFGFSGSVTVTRKGQTVFERAYGFADREKGVRNTPATIFETGSLGKQFTGAAILKLEEAGKLRTSDPISKYLDNVPEDKRAITIHQLLTMTGGIAPFGTTNGVEGTREGRVHQVLSVPLVAPPGTRMSYSNGGYNLLGAIVEKVSGMPYEAYVRKVLFQPAGLTSTGFIYEQPLPVDAAKIAKTYAGDEATDGRDFPPNLTWFFKGAGGAVTTTGDLCRWHAALTNKNILSKESLVKYYTPGSGQDGFAYGWGVFTTSRGREIEMGGGTTNGVGAKLARFPADDVCIAMTINQDGEAFNDPISAALIGLTFGDDVAMPPAVKPASAADLAKLAGTVRSGEATFDVQPAGRGLRLGAADAAALTMLFGSAPDLRSKTDPIIRGEVDGDFKPLQKARVDSVPLEQMTQRRSAIWAGWRESKGAFKSFTYIGGTPEPGGDAAANYRVDFEHGSVWLQYVWFPRGIDGVRILTEAPGLDFLPIGAGAFAAADLPARSFLTAHLGDGKITIDRMPMGGPNTRPARGPAVAVSFPDTPIGALARRFVESANAGEAAVREFITSAYTEKKLAERSVDERIGSFHNLRNNFGARLTLVRIERSSDSELDAVLRGANGNESTFQFSIDPASPGHLGSVMVKMEQGR
jgi:CubicO group peptidase (beta-lactamase class C family)